MPAGAGPKPETRNPVPKITDFGLAKRIDAEAPDVSKSGAIMGTRASAYQRLVDIRTSVRNAVL